MAARALPGDPDSCRTVEEEEEEPSTNVVTAPLLLLFAAAVLVKNEDALWNEFRVRVRCTRLAVSCIFVFIYFLRTEIWFY